MRQILIFFFFVISAYGYSQNSYAVQGTILDESQKKIALGDVILYQNGKTVQYTSISNGAFLFDDILAGTYTLKIISVGYATYDKEIQVDKDQQIKIILKEVTEVLDEVTIKINKKIIENRNGRILANVQGTMLSKETNTMELLSKLPNVQLSASGEEVSILGKGTPLIYIGGQRISLEELQSINVEDIKSIEIINNPSARYEAEGRAVLLITRNRSSQYGTVLTITERAYRRTFFNNTLGVRLNVKRNKFEYTLNAAYNQFKVWEKNTATYEVSDRNIFSDYAVEAVTTRPQFVFGGGMFYAINDTDYISTNTIYRTQEEPFSITTSTLLNDNGSLQNIATDSDNDGRRRFSSSNLNYFISLSERKNLFLGAQYTTYIRDVDNRIRNAINNAPTPDRVFISQDFNVESFVVKGDYDVTNKKGAKWEMGFNYAQNISKSEQNINGDQSNYEYKESIEGLYAQLTGKRKKINYTFGLRLENTQIEGGFLESSDLLVDRDNLYLFPRANMNFTLAEKKSIDLSYVRSISRPNYSTAIVNTAFINPGLEFRGNINLKPTITSEITTNFQSGDKSVSLRYFRSTDPVSFRFFYDEVDDITVMSPTNFNEENGIDLSVYLPFTHKSWTSTNSLSFSYIRLKDVRAPKGKVQPYIYYYSNQQFKINETSSFGFNGWAITNLKNGIFNRRGVFTINATFTTKLFSRLDVTLNTNDIFNTLEFQESYVLQNLRVQNLFFTDVNEFSISLRYKLGKIKNAKYQNQSVDRELDRIK